MAEETGKGFYIYVCSKCDTPFFCLFGLDLYLLRFCLEISWQTHNFQAEFEERSLMTKEKKKRLKLKLVRNICLLTGFLCGLFASGSFITVKSSCSL